MVKRGVSIDHVAEAGVVHLTGEGVGEADGSVVGAKAVWVSDRTVGSTFGGVKK